MSIETELIHRHSRRSNDAAATETNSISHPMCNEDDEMEPIPSLPSGADDEPIKSDTQVLDEALKNLNPRWKNWTIRTIFTCIMFFGFLYIVYLGPIALTVLIGLIFLQCFHELISIGLLVFKANHVSRLKLIFWYYFFVHNYFLLGATIYPRFGLDFKSNHFIYYFICNHSLRPKFYLKQFIMFGYLQCVLILFSFAYSFIDNALNGIIWFLMPAMLIIGNDTFAYIFGFFFGRTKLISISPKKTWEGFIGSGCLTIVLGFFVAAILVQFETLTNPPGGQSEEAVASVFRLSEFSLLGGLVRIPFYPFQLHTLVFGCVASSVSPFGGFFASGFKRAFRLKDFGNAIPGHGGFMDRVDCQIIMGLFVNVYVRTFIRLVGSASASQSVFNQLMSLDQDERLEFFRLLKNQTTDMASLYN